eukprot:jgi/Ulvmu1/2582/UM014_0033.1
MADEKGDAGQEGTGGAADAAQDSGDPQAQGGMADEEGDAGQEGPWGLLMWHKTV